MTADLIYPKGYEPVRTGLVRHGDIFLDANLFDTEGKVRWLPTEADDWGQPASDFDLVLRAPMFPDTTS